MARPDSTPNPLDSPASSSRTTTLDPSETTGSPKVSGTSATPGSGTLPGATGYGATGHDRPGDDGSRGVADRVKEEGKNLASAARGEARGMAKEAGRHVRNLVEERKDRTADQLGGFSGSLRDAARKLEDGGGGATALGGYAKTAADQVDRVSQYLRDRDLESFVRDAETFARKHPDVFLGGAFVGGLILARFLKASDRRQADDEPAGDWQGTGSGLSEGRVSHAGTA